MWLPDMSGEQLTLLKYPTLSRPYSMISVSLDLFAKSYANQQKSLYALLIFLKHEVKHITAYNKRVLQQHNQK
jgi:hypothetical protein